MTPRHHVGHAGIVVVEQNPVTRATEADASTSWYPFPWASAMRSSRKEAIRILVSTTRILLTSPPSPPGPGSSGISAALVSLSVLVAPTALVLGRIRGVIRPRGAPSTLRVFGGIRGVIGFRD
jgi:hypothetical protein